MLCVSTYVGQSGIHGVGLFAGEDIPAGTVVWKFTEGWYMPFPLGTIDTLPAHMRKAVIHYGYIDKSYPEKGFIFCLCDGRFMNHSPTPSLIDSADTCVARCDLKKGDELTSDYCGYYTKNKWQPWLEDLFAAAGK